MEELQFNFKASLILRCFLFSSFILCSVALGLTPIHLGVKSFLLLILMIYFLYVYPNIKLENAYLWRDNQGKFHFYRNLDNSKWRILNATIIRDSFTTSWFSILRLNNKKKTRSILIPADALSKDEYRALCLCMRVQTHSNKKALRNIPQG